MARHQLRSHQLRVRHRRPVAAPPTPGAASPAAPLVRALVVLALLAVPTALTAEQVAHWTFERDDPLTVDDTQAMWPATKHGFPGDGSETVPGVIGNALAFDGVDDYLSHDLELPRDEGTLSMWVQPVDQQPRVLVYDSDHPNGNTLYNGFGGVNAALENHVGQSTAWSFYYQDGSGPATNSGQRWAVSGGEVTPGVWTQYTATWDRDGDLVLYLDCVEVDREPIDHVTFEDLPHTTSLIGRPSEGGRFFQGLLDEVRVFDHALYGEEIRAAFCSFESEVGEVGPIEARGVPQHGFGAEVAMSGDWLAVLEPGEEDGPQAGRVHVYGRGADGSWLPETRLGLVGDVDTAAARRLSLHGDTLAVAAPNVAPRERVWIYSHDGSQWAQVAELETPPGAAPDLLFGASVALFGDRLFVGAPNSGSSPVPGQVFAYQLQGSPSQWTLTDTLTGFSDPGEFFYGYTLDYAHGLLAVSEIDYLDGIGSKIHLYRLQDLPANTPVDTVLAPATAVHQLAWDRQGPRPCISDPGDGDCIGLLVGRPFAASPGTEARGAAFHSDFRFPLLPGPGAGNLHSSIFVSPTELDIGDQFGSDVALHGDHLVVGTRPWAGDRGTAYLYRREAGGLRLLHQLRPKTWNPEPERFAHAVAIAGTWVVATAPTRGGPSSFEGAAFLYRTPVFSDGFESGDAGAWSNQVP